MYKTIYFPEMHRRGGFYVKSNLYIALEQVISDEPPQLLSGFLNFPALQYIFLLWCGNTVK